LHCPPARVSTIAGGTNVEALLQVGLAAAPLPNDTPDEATDIQRWVRTSRQRTEKMAVLLVATERLEMMEPTEMRKTAPRLELMEEATARLEKMGQWMAEAPTVQQTARMEKMDQANDTTKNPVAGGGCG